MMFTVLFSATGAQNTSTVMTAKGMAARFIKGKRLPFGFVLRSDMDAIHGSVTASKIRHTKAISPNTVRIPNMTSPVGM